MLLMVLFLVESASWLSGAARESSHRQQLFDRLVSVADYSAKIGLAMREGEVRHPNWLDLAKLTAGYSDSLREKAGLSSLYIGLEEPPSDSSAPGYPMCIYRLVVAGDGKEIRKLYVCGE